MADIRKINWEEILSEIVNKLPSNQEIHYRENLYLFKYIGYPTTRMGFLIIWEKKSKRAVNISRVKVPDNFPMLDINDPDKFKGVIPDDLKIENMY